MAECTSLSSIASAAEVFVSRQSYQSQTGICEAMMVDLRPWRAYFGDTHPGISVISTQFVSYKMALGCKFIISFLNSHLLSQNDAKSVQFCPGSHQQ